jgi:hypothetical protein
MTMHATIQEEVQALLAAVAVSLAAERAAKATAIKARDAALELKRQSAATVAGGEKEAAHAHRMVAEHVATMKAQRDARAQARAERIAEGRTSGGAVPAGTDDADLARSRRLAEDADEADAALAQLRAVDERRAMELQKAESAVTAAGKKLEDAGLLALAAQIDHYDKLMRALHSELRAVLPAPMDMPPGMLSALPQVERALSLVVIDQLHVPVNQLRGGTMHNAAWAERRAALIAGNVAA